MIFDAVHILEHGFKLCKTIELNKNWSQLLFSSWRQANKRACYLRRAWEALNTMAPVFEMTPPLTFSDGEVDRALDILNQAFGDVEEGRVSDKVLEEFAGW